MILIYDVDFPGEMDAGLRAFTDTITIMVESGDPGGDLGEFADFMRDCLSQWFDGAGIDLRKCGG